jgi:uncharacterized protein (TIGR02466 family)
LKVAGLFPTPIAVIEMDEKFHSIGKELQKIKIKKESDELTSLGNIQGNALQRGGLDSWGHISDTNYVLNDPKFDEFRNSIISHCEEFVSEVLCYNRLDLVMTQSWISIKRPGQRHNQHSHANSLISGVFYWHEDITPILFTKPSLGQKQLDPGYNYEKLDTVLEARPIREISVPRNHLVLFESTLLHEVPENNNKKDRYSLAFNTFPKSIGFEDTLTRLETRL